MCVHITDVVRLDAAVRERHRHRACGARAGRVGLGHVQRVRRHAVPDKLGVDSCTARPCVLELLEHENRTGLAHHQTVAFPVERTRRA